MSNHVFTEDLHQEMGLMTSYRWAHEPRGVLFMLSRYKFVAKMLEGREKVLEIGCGDGFGSRIVRPSVQRLICIDKDQAMIDSAKKCHGKFDIDFFCTDRIEYADAIYSLDVIEHIEYEASREWLKSIAAHSSMAIIGTPSLESQKYASPLSKQNHINCFTGTRLRDIMYDYFTNVMLFSMNDEVVHTGFNPLSHYNFLIGTA